MPTWDVVITGCGTSHGNPPWGYPDWWSTDPRDLRRRSGAQLYGPDGQVVLIDVGPDLAHQLRDPDRTWDGRSYPARCVVRCDGILLTHDHADHAHGVNDIRHLNRLGGGAPVHMYGHRAHLEAMAQMFPYCFGKGDDFYRQSSPTIIAIDTPDFLPREVAGLPVTCVPLSHGPAGRTTGFRCGSLAYLTDFKTLPPESEPWLVDCDLLVLDMLRAEPHPTHLCWDEAAALIERLRPRRTILTHMGHEVRYREWETRLPSGVVMAYDGMRATFAV